jgi:SAM-dependent methyltransferase
MFDSGLSFPVLRDMDVVGGEPLSHDVCPVCFSHSRTRLICEYLQREAPIGQRSSTPRVLHVAPEYALMVYLSKLSDYTGADIDPEEYKAHGSVVYCDITDIGFPDNTFDLIVCCHVLEHVPRDDLAISELYRVLKPGAPAILQVPISVKLNKTIEDPSITDPRERERRFGQFDHVRIYGSDYPQRLAAAGFEVEILDPSQKWGAGVVAASRLNPRERLFVGKKGDSRSEIAGQAT